VTAADDEDLDDLKAKLNERSAVIDHALKSTFSLMIQVWLAEDGVEEGQAFAPHLVVGPFTTGAIYVACDLYWASLPASTSKEQAVEKLMTVVASAMARAAAEQPAGAMGRDAPVVH
jgi:hypothetical protein